MLLHPFWLLVLKLLSNNVTRLTVDTLRIYRINIKYTVQIEPGDTARRYSIKPMMNAENRKWFFIYFSTFFFLTSSLPFSLLSWLWCDSLAEVQVEEAHTIHERMQKRGKKCIERVVASHCTCWCLVYFLTFHFDFLARQVQCGRCASHYDEAIEDNLDGDRIHLH